MRKIYLLFVFLHWAALSLKAQTYIITTIAGNGTQSGTGNGGPATSVPLYFPTGIALDDSGNVYIADYSQIHKVSAKTGIITTIAGNGTLGGSGDGGPATSAELYFPNGVALDDSENVYIAD